MTSSSAKLTGGAMSIAMYLCSEKVSGLMGLAHYYAGEGGGLPSKPGKFAPDDLVFRADQIHGSGAAALGWDLSLGLTMEAFANVMDGRHPVSGEQLTKAGHAIEYETDPATGKPLLDANKDKVRKIDPATGEPVKAEAKHTNGIDVFFSAPKSVSILAVAAWSNPELQAAIYRAHDQAVCEALRWVEHSARLGRRTVATPSEAGERLVTKGPRKGEPCKTQGSQSERFPVQLVIVSARQHTARPTEATMERGAPPDMHLHSHNVILGIAFDPVTGKCVTPDDYGLKSTAVERDARYMAALARNLEAAGIELEHGSFEDFEGGKGRVPWRVKGITEEAVNHYSSNRERAWKLIKDYEEFTGKAATGPVLRERMKGTRRAKDPLAKRMDAHPIYELWDQDADRSGITMTTPELQERLKRTPAPIERAPLAERVDVLWRRLDSANGLTKDGATFDAASATTSLARCAEGLGFTEDELMMAELTMWDRLVKDPASPEKRPTYTTSKVLDDERYIDAQLHEKAATVYPAPTRESIYRAITSQPVSLDKEQWAAIADACSGRGVTVWEGLAGTGKTTALKAAVAALRESGDVSNVVMVSTAALTAKESGRKVGADFAGSVESLAIAVAHGRVKVDQRTLVIFDESAMCDTRRQVTFQKLTEKARVLYVGDPEQAQAIGAAGWYADATTTWLPKSMLTNVHRQKDHHDVAALAQLREGEAVDVVANLTSRGRFHVAEDHQGRLWMAQQEYVSQRARGHSATDVRIILDASNTEVDTANRQVQRYRLDRGEIGKVGYEVEATGEDRRWTLHEGDAVLFLQPYGKGKTRIRNGTSGVVRALDVKAGRAMVTLEDGRIAPIKLQASAERQPVGLAYAVHTQKFQGSEVPVVLAVPGSAGVTNKNTAYSTLSRCTAEMHVYVDHETHGKAPEVTLAAAWSRAPSQVSARRLIGEVMPADPPGGGPPSDKSPDLAEVLAVKRHMTRLERVIGEDATDQVRTAPAYPALAARLTELDRTGADTTAMLRKVATERPLTTADDPAAVIVYRLHKADRIERGEAPANRPYERLPDPLPPAPIPPPPAPKEERFSQLDEIRAAAQRIQDDVDSRQQSRGQEKAPGPDFGF